MNEPPSSSREGFGDEAGDGRDWCVFTAGSTVGSDISASRYQTLNFITHVLAGVFFAGASLDRLV